MALIHSQLARHDWTCSVDTIEQFHICHISGFFVVGQQAAHTANVCLSCCVHIGLILTTLTMSLQALQLLINTLDVTHVNMQAPALEYKQTACIPASWYGISDCMGARCCAVGTWT